MYNFYKFEYHDYSADFVLSVKPECRIDEERIDGDYYLVCSATANPKESDFTWSLKSDNDTLDQIGEIRDGKGYLRLDTSVTNFRTYVCVANNSIGFSVPCERGVPGKLINVLFVLFYR